MAILQVAVCRPVIVDDGSWWAPVWLLCWLLT